MKLFRDLFAAILVGIMGGFLLTTISYYNGHKDEGIAHTLMAIMNSLNVIGNAYGGEDVYAVDFDDYELEENVQAVFDQKKGRENIKKETEDSEIEPFSGVIRFHVRANSDTKEDQELKMAVKEDVVTMLQPLLENCKTTRESKNVIVSAMPDIYQCAVNTIIEQGYDYSVSVYVTEEDFPEKTYGDVTFPAGRYQALRIDIGEAKGHNWWCVLFPPLCFIDETTAVVSEEGKELLKENLSEKEYEEIMNASDCSVEPSCKLFEKIQDRKEMKKSKEE